MGLGNLPIISQVFLPSKFIIELINYQITLDKKAGCQPEKYNNRICDGENNYYQCEYDHGDCCIPWRHDIGIHDYMAHSNH